MHCLVSLVDSYESDFQITEKVSVEKSQDVIVISQDEEQGRQFLYMFIIVSTDSLCLHEYLLPDQFKRIFILFIIVIPVLQMLSQYYSFAI